jgi:hypothetical protein
MQTIRVFNFRRQFQLGLCGILAASLFIVISVQSASVRVVPIRSGEQAPVVVLQRHGQSVRGTIHELPFVVLRGTVEERGKAYGALCGADVVSFLNDTLLPLMNRESGSAWNELSRRVESTFAFPTDTLDQMKSFITGLEGAADDQARTLKTLGRDLRVEDLKVMQVLADLLSSGRFKFGGCSSFSAWGDLAEGNELISGRNLDYMTFPGKLPFLVLAQEPSEAGKQKTIEVSMAGIFGATTAMNEEGVLIMLHDEAGLPPARQTDFVPRVTALREAIEKARATNAVADVAGALRHVPVIMGGNIHVSFPLDPARPDHLPAVIEWDGNSRTGGVTVRNPAAGGLEAIFCTNDFLERRSGAPAASNCSHYKSMVQAASNHAKHGRKIGFPMAVAIMDRAAVRGDGSTHIAVIARPNARQLMVAVAPKPGASATDGEWVEVNWNAVFSQK